MTRYYIESDEMYPVHSLTEATYQDSRGAVEIPEEFIRRYEAARKEWHEVQDILSDYEDQADRQYREWLSDPANACQKPVSGYYGYLCHTPLVGDGKCPYDEGEAWAHIDRHSKGKGEA